MTNVLRTLVFDGQVSLTVADTTAIVKKAIQLHKLSPVSAYVFGKAISAMTFASACLKGEKGEISLAVKTDGEAVDIAVSGNHALGLRGYIENTQIQGDDFYEGENRALGQNGSLTIIRDDGYARPFVGSCAIPSPATVDTAFETYYAVSEQLPTRIVTDVRLDKKGRCVYAAVAVLQPLPFADNAALNATQTTDLQALLDEVQKQGVEQAVKATFTVDTAVWETRMAKYKCNCSRPYLKKLIISLGEPQMRQIIAEDGAVRVHCHYCNKDYAFTEEDADSMFGKKENK